MFSIMNWSITPAFILLSGASERGEQSSGFQECSSWNVSSPPEQVRHQPVLSSTGQQEQPAIRRRQTGPAAWLPARPPSTLRAIQTCRRGQLRRDAAILVSLGNRPAHDGVPDRSEQRWFIGSARQHQCGHEHANVKRVSQRQQRQQQRQRQRRWR